MKSFTKFLAFSFLMVALSFQVRVASANQDAEVKLAEMYLVKLTTGNRPACLWNEKYMMDYLKVKKENINNVMGHFKNWSLEKQPEEWGFKNDRLFCAFVTKDDTFEVSPDEGYKSLFSLIEKDDRGEAITTWIDSRLEGNYYVVIEKPITNLYATNDKKNVPIIVDSTDGYGYINLKAKMVDEDLDKYFYNDVSNEYLYPSVGLCWTTTWDDLKGRWKKLLAEGNKIEVITQICTISEKGRFERPGGTAWKERIDGFEKSLYPSFTIINSTEVDCEGEIDWVNSTTRKSVATTPISKDGCIRAGWSSTVDIPSEEFAKLNDGETLSPTVTFWVPNNPCCGKIERKSVVQFEKYGEDFKYEVKVEGESWFTNNNAKIELKLENRNGKKCIISYLDKNEELNSDTHIISIPAHTEVSIEIKEPASKEVIGRKDVKKLHKGETIRPIIVLNPSKPKAKPKLEKMDDIEFPKDGLFTLSINNGLGGVVFNGKLDDYENGASIKDRLDATNIPVAISEDGRDIQEILYSYLRIPKEISPGWKLVRQANGYIIISYNGSIPNDKYLELPKTLKVVNRDECIEAILQLNKQPVEKRKLMKTVSEKMPSWKKDALIGAARENNFAAAIELKNNTRRDLFVDGLTGKIAVNSSVRLSGENIDTIKIREDEYSFEEYEDSSNIFSIKSFNPLGDDQSISISEETLVKKRATKVLFKDAKDINKDAKDINEVTISYSDNKSYSYSSKKNIADGIELRMHIDISNIEIKWINGKTTSVRLPKSRYRYGEDDITITVAKPPDPPPPPPSSCSKCGTILNNGVCEACSKDPPQQQSKCSKCDGAWGRLCSKWCFVDKFKSQFNENTFKDNPASYNSAMKKLTKLCSDAKEKVPLEQFKKLCEDAGIPEEVIEKLK